MNNNFNVDDFHSKTEHLNDLFDLIKNNKENDFIEYITKLKPGDVDVNIRDNNGNYLIFFLSL